MNLSVEFDQNLVLLGVDKVNPRLAVGHDVGVLGKQHRHRLLALFEVNLIVWTVGTFYWTEIVIHQNLSSGRGLLERQPAFIDTSYIEIVVHFTETPRF